MKTRAVIKVNMKDQKSRSKALKIAAELPGTESAALQGDDKSLLEVTGDGIDPVQLVRQLRKAVGHAEVVSVSAAVDKENKDYKAVKLPIQFDSNSLSTLSLSDEGDRTDHLRKAATHLMKSLGKAEEAGISPDYDWLCDQPEEKQVHQHEHTSAGNSIPCIQKPELVSIGPYHIDKELPLNKYKYSFLETFLSRNQGKDLCFYVQQMMKLESRTRICYSKVFSMGSYEFVEMMLVDGCFLMQVLTHFGRSEESENGYFPIEPWQIPILVRDLLMLENQIPFFVLEKLFDLSKSEEATTTTVSLQSMALKFIDLAFPLSMDFNCIINHLEAAPQHLLHLLLQTIRPSNPPKPSTSKAVDEADEVKVYLESSARELQKSGIEFRPRRADRFMDIHFKNGVLEIPPVTINDLFIAILVNGIAFEQCSTGCSKDITAYVCLMSSLIRHPTDVELLCSDGIISRFSHDDEQVVSSLADLQSKISDLGIPQDSSLYMTITETKRYRIPSFGNSWLGRFGIIFSVVVTFSLFFFSLSKQQGKQAMLEESMLTTVPSIWASIFADLFVLLNLTIGTIWFAASLASNKLYRSPSVLQRLKSINLYSYLFPEPTIVVREGKAKATEEDIEVDAKADDFINKFKQQLKLQRIDSMLQYKEMVNRGSGRGSPTAAENERSTSLTDNLLGLLRIRVKRGINLAIRDVRSSDPYVVIKMGKQKLKTRIIKKNVNPEWNEDLTLSITDPSLPIKLTVYDYDTFSLDDKMGDAEFDIRAYLEALKMKLEGIPSGTIISKVQPGKNNCLAEESTIYWSEGKVVQDICLRLRNVECGEVEIQIQWIDIPGSKSL